LWIVTIQGVTMNGQIGLFCKQAVKLIYSGAATA
jgi:hypothetical protein